MPVALAVLLLPLGVWRLSAHQRGSLEEQHLSRCRAILKPWQTSPSVKAGHPPPVAKLDWLEAKVEGVVPTLAERETIRASIDKLQGVECAAAGVSTLRVMPHLTARREGDTLFLTGELPQQETLTSTVTLMQRAEPGLKVDGSAVKVDAAVLGVAVTSRVQDAAADPLLAQVWRQVQYAWPDVRMDFSGPVPRIAGKFPDQDTRDRVVAAIRSARPDLKVEDAAAGVDRTLPPVDFTAAAEGDTRWQPPAWMREAWELWTVYPALHLREERGTLKLHGVIPSAALKASVLLVLRRMRPDLEFSEGDLEVRNGSLDKPMVVPARLDDWTPPPWLQPLIAQLRSLPRADQSPTD